jgi:recombination protein RecT
MSTQSIRQTVATRDAEQPTVGQFIQRLVPEIARALPKHMDADRIARLALTVVRKDQALARCQPESFAGALLTASALGLEPGVNGEAYLVAYKNECTLIVGYQGFAKLFWQHPMAKHLDAQAVHEKDDFDYAYGLEPFLRHKPARGDRGAITDYYAVASLTSGARVFVVLSVDEVKKLRNGKVGSNGGIPDPMHWMERKTALRQLVKMLPKSTALAHALDADEKTGTELRNEQLPAIAPPSSQTELPPGVDGATGEVIDQTAADWPPVTEPPAGS